MKQFSLKNILTAPAELRKLSFKKEESFKTILFQALSR